MIRKGVVRWFSVERGYGFILDCDDGEEVFVHYATIPGRRKGMKNLEEGDKVEYTRSNGNGDLRVSQILNFTRGI